MMCAYFMNVGLGQVQVEGRVMDIVDDEWRKEKLPEEDIAVPIAELPDPEVIIGYTEIALEYLYHSFLTFFSGW